MALKHTIPSDTQSLVPYTTTTPATPELSFNERQIALIKSQIAPDVNDGELGLFLEVCRATGLNPLFKQIYAIVRSKDDAKNRKMTIQTGIDGYRLLASRTESLAGIDDATFDLDASESWHPSAARVTVWRFVQGQRVPFTATARWSEYAQKNYKGEYTGMWTKGKMPFAQLAKCAEALALRKACPAELSGIYTGEEMGQADNPAVMPTAYVEATSEPAPRARPQTPRNAAAPAKASGAWKALSDPEVLQLLNSIDIRGRDDTQAFMGTVKAAMEAEGLAWTRDQVLEHLRENYVAEADVVDSDSNDLSTIETGAPGN